MRRFFIPLANISHSTAYIDGTDVNHLHNVLRKDVGDELEVTDGAGHILQVKITQVTPERIDFTILSQREQASLGIHIRVFQAIPRGTSMEILIEKLSELGAAQIIPVMTERSIPRYEGDKASKKQARWQRLADETCKKMGAGSPTRIGDIIPLKAMASMMQADRLALLAWEVEQTQTLKQALCGYTQNKDVDIMIGPEGGFSQSEIDTLLEWGFKTVSLGPRVLKVATASIVTVANIIYEWSRD